LLLKGLSARSVSLGRCAILGTNLLARFVTRTRSAHFDRLVTGAVLRRRRIIDGTGRLADHRQNSDRAVGLTESVSQFGQTVESPSFQQVSRPSTVYCRCPLFDGGGGVRPQVLTKTFNISLNQT